MPFNAVAGRDLNGDAQVTDYVPGTSLDMRVSKSFALGATRKIDLIAQVFNVFGNDNLLASGGGAGAWVSNALSNSFGRILTALNRQQAELGVRVGW